MSKKILLTTLILSLLTSCVVSVSGAIHITQKYVSEYYSYFNYSIADNNIYIEARIGGIDYRGGVYKIRDSFYDNNKQNNSAILSMRGTNNRIIECYISQNSPRSFAKGGFGTCYSQGVRLFDIQIIEAYRYFSSGFIKALGN